MRITGGIHRSRKLETPKSDAVRPTSDKVRQAIFNMLNARGEVEHAVVIDAFCGTGALGLEALSQGAHFCTFFDKNKNSVQLCKNNIESLGEEKNTKIMLKDVTKINSSSDNFSKATLVFLDPPYHQELVPKAINSLIDNDWLATECFFVIEMAKNETIFSDHIEILNQKIYGDTQIILAQLKSK
jgi:16S rRNA (guanine966-N2)-methyltransferase